MARAYPADMRQRVIDHVESGGSRREAAEHYEMSPSRRPGPAFFFLARRQA
jgi:hypothetical protein